MRLKSYVHLDYGRSLESWANLYEKGMVFEKKPYGYHLAESWIDLKYSQDFNESKVIRFVRRGFKALLGFDLIHAFHNRHVASSVDLIWTHTEAEYLADAVLMKFGLMKRRPIIGQSVWLWDNWKNFSWVKVKFYRWLLEEVTVPTTLSSANAKIASEILGRKVFFVPFGIEPTFDTGRTKYAENGRIKIVAPGNDKHRDWRTLREVARNNQDMEIVVLSKRWRARCLISKKVPNFIVRQVKGVKEIINEYSQADVVSIPLLPNFHASGITVAMEGLSARRPVVITKTGGVEDYFGDSVNYAEPLDPIGMAASFRVAYKAGKDNNLMDQRREHIFNSGLLIKDYALRHFLLSALAMKLSTADQSLKISKFSPVII